MLLFVIVETLLSCLVRNLNLYVSVCVRVGVRICACIYICHEMFFWAAVVFKIIHHKVFSFTNVLVKSI